MRLVMISLVVSTLGGCVDNNSDGGLFIVKNVAVAATCVFTADPSEAYLPSGTLDVSFGGQYVFHPQVKSRITALITEVDQRTILLKGANISIAFPNPPAGVTLPTSGLQFRQLFSGPVAPNGGITDTAFVIIPSSVSLAIRPLLSATVPTIVAVVSLTIDGEMAGGVITSQKFDYPVNLTTGLVIDNGTCPLPMGFGTIRAGNACNPQQDAVVDCCHDANNILHCPAT